MRTTADVHDHLSSNGSYDEPAYEIVKKCLVAISPTTSILKKTGLVITLIKGIFISGPIGCGKTYLMKLLQKNMKCHFLVKDCREIADLYSKGGSEAIEKYSTEWHHLNQTTYKYENKLYPYCFDDLGTEPDKKYFGTDDNVMLDILLKRYNRGNFIRTHVATNLSATELKERYGARMTSRFKEMFNLINFPTDAVDRRK